ncbi:MAG: LysR family transcriptional regulator [Desulfuromonadales bacterium]
MQSFDTATLRVFLATARLGSIGAAARSEHIAISAASRRISDLENDLDTILIARTPTGVRLTSAGKVFAHHCEQLLSKYTDIRADLKRFADGEAGDFRIAVIPWAMTGSLPSLIAHFKKTHPSVHVTVQEIFTRDGIRFLREDLADLAIIYDTGELDGFEVMPFKKDPVWVVGSHDHPLFQGNEDKSSIDFVKTLDYEHISLHEGSVLDELIAEARRKEGRIPKYDIKLMRFNSLVKCVEAGLGLGIIGEKDLRPYMNDKKLKAVPLSDSWASRNLVFAFPKAQAASPLVSSFLKCISEREAEM